MSEEKPKDARLVTFERGIPAHMMAIDGTWRRACTAKDVSETEATLVVEGSVQGLAFKEFFLLLSSTGLAYRRCELDWVNGDQMGVNFLRQRDKKKKSEPRPATFGEGCCIRATLPCPGSDKLHSSTGLSMFDVYLNGKRDLLVVKGGSPIHLTGTSGRWKRKRRVVSVSDEIRSAVESQGYYRRKLSGAKAAFAGS
jgi:hypothetical protein